MNAVVRPGAQIDRDRWGRPLVVLPDGSKRVGYRRCTSFIDVLDDRYNLELWKQRQVADGLARRPDLVLKAAAAAGDKTELNDVTKQALEAAGSSSAATTGSAVHSLTEQLDRGQDPIIPPGTTADIDAYRATTSHLVMHMIEVFVVHDGYQVGGTFDRVVQINGVRYVADIKTGSIDYAGSKIAMQLALYSRSQLYDIRSGKRSDLDVHQQRGLVIHLPAGAGECSLHWCDLDAGWEGVRVCRQVWDWRSRKGLLEASAPEPPSIQDLISKCPDVESLRALWAAHEHDWTDHLTTTAKARIAQLAG
ncbi:MAG: hypothetical protein ACRDQH_02475 [Pseudonocardiaceae bacterium]